MVNATGPGRQLQQDAEPFGGFMECLLIKRAAQGCMHKRELHGHPADAVSPAAVLQLFGRDDQVYLLLR